MELDAAYARLRPRQERGIWHLTLHPAAGHSEPRLDAELTAELLSCLQRLTQSSQARAIVLHSSSAEHWCSGMDLSAVLASLSAAKTPDDLAPTLQAYAKILSILSHATLPVLAVVQGKVQGGGVGLLCACDRVLALDTVTISLPETLVGLTPAMVLPVLQRRIGPKSARWLAMSGQTLLAPQAQALGLVDELLSDPSSLQKSLRAALKLIGRRSPAAMAQIAQQLGHTPQDCSPTLEGQLLSGAAQTLQNIQDPSVQRAIQTLLDGELPRWDDAKPKTIP